MLLAIETSCDETAAAVMSGPVTVAGECIASQIKTHQKWGGVVPEVASREHAAALHYVVEQALSQAGASLRGIKAVAVTRGPGLVGALLTGISYAKGLSLALDVPLIGVHHMAGHIAAGRLARASLAPPYVCLVVSGGHTMLLEVTEHPPTLLGKTRDDAAGEAFDKAARILGLGYPGGPAIDTAAVGGNPHALTLPRAKIAENPLDFSFSGLKTALMQHKNLGSVSISDAAASFRQAVVEVLIDHAMAAIDQTGHKTLVIAGGVAANAALRQGLAEICGQRGIDLILPPKPLCTDNAAMIGVQGWRMWENGEIAGPDMDAMPRWPLVY